MNTDFIRIGKGKEKKTKKKRQGGSIIGCSDL